MLSSIALVRASIRRDLNSCGLVPIVYKSYIILDVQKIFLVFYRDTPVVVILLALKSPRVMTISPGDCATSVIQVPATLSSILMSFRLNHDCMIAYDGCSQCAAIYMQGLLQAMNLARNPVIWVDMTSIALNSFRAIRSIPPIALAFVGEILLNFFLFIYLLLSTSWVNMLCMHSDASGLRSSFINNSLFDSFSPVSTI